MKIIVSHANVHQIASTMGVILNNQVNKVTYPVNNSQPLLSATSVLVQLAHKWW